jgi:hypothetical protein
MLQKQQWLAVGGEEFEEIYIIEITRVNFVLGGSDHKKGGTKN